MREIIYALAIVFGINFLFTLSQKENKIIYVQGLNEYEIEDLYLVAKTIEENFDYECHVLKEPHLVQEESVLESEEIQSQNNQPTGFLFDKKKPIKVLVTNLRITSPMNPSVLGVTYGNTIYISARDESVTKITIVHEMYHNFGLDHCQNKCVMNIQRNKDWDKMKNKPILCDECRKKLEGNK